MRTLEINPQKFDIELCVVDKEAETKNQYGTMTVKFRFGSVDGMTTFTRPELDRIGRWFVSAGKEAGKRKRKAKTPRKPRGEG